jgi:nucleoside-diphosphate-sugar epimerase
MIRFLSLFDPSIKTILPQLGRTWIIDNTRMREVLGIEPRDTKEAVRETERWLAART